MGIFHKKGYLVLIAVILLCIIAVSYIVYSMWYAKKKTKQEVDFSPLLNLEYPDEFTNITDLFEHLKENPYVTKYEISVIDGTSIYNNRKRTDDMKERISFYYKNGTVIHVNIEIYYNMQATNESYDFNYNRLEEHYGISFSGSAGFIKYLSTYTERQRLDMFPGFLVNSYLSNSYIKASNMVIGMLEDSESSEISKKDEVIKLLAEYIEKYIKEKDGV